MLWCSAAGSVTVFAQSHAAATIYLLRNFVWRLFLSSLLDTTEVEESDPFADVEDENELEESSRY